MLKTNFAHTTGEGMEVDFHQVARAGYTREAGDICNYPPQPRLFLHYCSNRNIGSAYVTISDFCQTENGRVKPDPKCSGIKVLYIGDINRGNKFAASGYLSRGIKRYRNLICQSQGGR